MLRTTEQDLCVAKETYHCAVTLVLHETQIAIDTNAVDVRPHAGAYCRKGAWCGPLTFENYDSFVSKYARLARPGTLLIIERIRDDYFAFGICHAADAVCCVEELERPYLKWIRDDRKIFPTVTREEWEDLQHDVYVKVAAGLQQEKFLIDSPCPFFNMAARRIQFSRWRKRKSTSMSPEVAAAIPCSDSVFEVLEIADEMAAALAQPETMRCLRRELLDLDPSGVLLFVGRYLRNKAPEGMSRFFETLVETDGDPAEVSAKLGIAPDSVRTYLYRLKQFLLPLDDQAGEAA